MREICIYGVPNLPFGDETNTGINTE
jgi:hypothetical protein